MYVFIDGISAIKNDFSTLQDPFIQEMRRYYPFFPMLPAISLKEVEVDGYRIPETGSVTYQWVQQSLFLEVEVSPFIFRFTEEVKNDTDTSTE
ncbi:hypothetical protein EfmAA242_27660 [Enterococcus faecium]|nr:hypothetical protein EfmAA242_27660 [Enterococcus faecium]